MFDSGELKGEELEVVSTHMRTPDGNMCGGVGPDTAGTGHVDCEACWELLHAEMERERAAMNEHVSEDEEWVDYISVVEHVRIFSVKVSAPKSWTFDEINGMAAAKAEHGHNGEDVRDLGRVTRVVKTSRTSK